MSTTINKGRRKTHPVQIGTLMLGSDYPIAIQSMLNTSTMDTEACVEQAIRIIEAGGQLVRITAQGVREAENLKNIREQLTARGYTTPLSADIHFTPDAAMIAARYVEKVRINPGNFIDKRATFKEYVYTDEEYVEELKRIETKFTAFLDICREHHTAVRIGTNHGSLSDRIMNRYGNTPLGMVEATMEYLRICKTQKFDNVVISLKSSDCRMMTSAVRLLVKTMNQEDMDYPIHLGVTEAGEGEDGRIRSAIGTGTLLNEGIGDTLRVSLTEEPEAEIPVGLEICSYANARYGMEPIIAEHDYNTHPVIVADLSNYSTIDMLFENELGFKVIAKNNPIYGKMLESTLRSPEIIYTETLSPALTQLPNSTIILVDSENIDMAHVYNRNAVPLFTLERFMELRSMEYESYYVCVTQLEQITSAFKAKLNRYSGANIVIACEEPNIHLLKDIISALDSSSCPIIIKCPINNKPLQIAVQLGALYLDRLVHGIWLQDQAIATSLSLSRNVLQSVGSRRYKPEFISCPGCGRTLYNLQDAVARVKKAFGHLNRLKIAVMGCVVNGPGEMGDADYGYVGAGSGKVNLYKGKQLIRSAVPQEQAIAALRELIRENNDWEE